MKHRIPILLLVLAMVLGIAAIGPQARAAGLLVADGGFGGVLEIEEHAVDVTIDNGIAVTRVTQLFRNTEQRQVEALYTFPVPKGASVANFSMWIDGREMIGEVVEKERARQIYDSYKQVRRDPGLLEQVDYKTFEMRIFPIGPRAEQRVEITYYQELDVDDGWASYVYPLATTTRDALDSTTRGRFAFTVETRSEIPIVELTSPTHAAELVFAQHGPHLARASLETTGGDLNRDVVVAYRLARPATGVDLIASKRAGEDGYFLLTLTAGDELGKSRKGMDYVFILDISGSMNNDGKLAVSRESLAAFVEALADDDRFEVITFNVAPTTLFGELRAADMSATGEASRFLSRQQAKGGTFLDPALRAAYRYKNPDRPLNVVILSDGMTEQAERQTLLQLIGERPGATRVFAIGVGNEVNRPLLEQLADDAGGLAAFVSRGDDFERQATAFRRKLLRPVASNLELEADDGVLFDVEPRRLPNLFHGSPLRLYGRYRSAGPATIAIRGDLGGERFERVMQVELPGDGAERPELERMWAGHRVQRLLKQADRAGSREPVVDEIVRLGEQFSIVTEYTSFLVLENDAEYRRWKIDRRNALRTTRDREAQQQVRESLAAMRRRADESIGPIARRSPSAAEPASKPGPVSSATPAARPTGGGAAPSGAPSRGWDLDLGGGGALDPFSLGLALGLAGIGAAAHRRRRAGR